MTESEKERYSRNILLEGFGIDSQEKLLKSSALIVGAGALGTVVAMYLAGAGVGRITIADYDTVDISNLQRQPAFTTDDIGKNKAEALADHISRLNPDIKIKVLNEKIDSQIFDVLLMGIDLVAECSDNPQTKLSVTSACERLGIPYVLGGVAQYRGQVMAWQPGATHYTDVFADTETDTQYRTAKQAGVFAPLPGVIASLQASEAIKILGGVGESLTGRLITYDAHRCTFAEYVI